MTGSPPTGIALAAIAAAVFVQRDAGGGTLRRLITGTANCRSVGVGPEYATAAGSSLPYQTNGYAKLTYGGTVVAGDRLKSDATGFGVVLAVGGTVPQNVGALAVVNGSANDVVDVQVEIYTEQPGDYLS